MREPSAVQINFLGSLWNFFASIRLTVVVLLSLAVLSIIGTLIPQNQSPAEYFRIFGPFRYQLMTTLDLFDMYHSWWFQFLLLMLTANIIVCSIDRLQTTWKIIFVKSPRFNLEKFRKRKNRHEFQRAGSPAVLAPLFEKRVASAFVRGQLIPSDAGFAITAEKGRWTRLGVYGVHLSIIILLIGALMGSHFGFEGYVNIAEGDRTDTIQLRNSSARLTLPFSIQCDAFSVQFYEGGRRPKEYRSSLSIIEGDQIVLQKDIIVNDPLRYRGINIFQSSYGEVGRSSLGSDTPLPEKIELNFRSAASGMIYSHTAALGESVQIPEGLGHFQLDRYEPAAVFGGTTVGPSILGTLTDARGQSETVLLPLNHPGFDGMRRGAVVISIGNAPPAPQPRYYTGLQVTKDPGVWMVYLGFAMMIAGCMVAFFMSHQRLVVEIQPDTGGVRIMVSGTTDRNKAGFRQKLKRLADQLEKVS